MGWFDTLFELKHSDIFTLPIIRYSPVPLVAREKIHTLCHIVAEIEDTAICTYPIHLQFYGYNDLYQSLMARKMGVCASLLAPFVRALAVRLSVIFGYLHSGVSSTLSMKLIDRRHPKLELAGKPSAHARIIIRAAARKLYQNRRYFQAIPLERLLRLDLPGGGYHTGDIFPMRNEPGAFETDRMGSLASMPAVHIVEMIGSISCHLFLRSVNPSLRISFFLPINRYM
jgi:hypothetical protein